MGKLFKNILLFLLMVLIVYPFLIFLSGYIPLPEEFKNPNLNYRIGSYGHMLSRIKEAKRLNKDVDILFLGSSHAYRGFDPRNFHNKTTFNLGSSSQSPLQTKILLERYLDMANPKMVIYEVYPGTFESDGVESSLDLIANDKNDCRSVKMALKLNNIKTYNTLFYAFYSDLFQLNNNFEEPIQKGKDTYISGGFVESDIQKYKIIDQPKREWNLNEKQLHAFKECLALLEKKNIKTVLVFAPITSVLYNSYTNNYYIDSLFNSYRLAYYNFNPSLQLKDSLHFYDAHHLNQFGVNAFNDQLLKTLKIENQN